MKGSIDTEKLNIQLMPEFSDQATVMEQAPMYAFDISPSVKEISASEPGQLKGIELDLRTEKPSPVFGADIFPQATFEGEFPFALAAGALIVTVVGGVIAYGLWQAQQAISLGTALAQPGIAIAGAISEVAVEAIKPTPEASEALE